MKIRSHIHLFLVLVVLFISLTACEKKEEKVVEKTQEVDVIAVEPRQVDLRNEYTGQVYGAADTPIRARVEGVVTGIHFEEGAEVKQGQLLYTIENKEYEANVAELNGRLSAAKTNSALATKELQRMQKLDEDNLIAKADLDSATANFKAAQAEVEAAEAALNAAQAVLGYTEIVSPSDGIIGRTKAKLGDFVGRAPNPVILNTVSELGTVRVEFFITESHYLEAADRLAQLEKDSEDPEKAREKIIELILADGSVYPHKGWFNFLDRDVDPQSGSILIQVSFPNPDNLLRSGQFAKVRTVSSTVLDAIVVPQRCVSDLQGIKRVYVVGDDDKVSEREVSLGRTIGSDWLVLDGLETGEKIVYEGLQKIREGMVVKPNLVQIQPATDTEK